MAKDITTEQDRAMRELDAHLSAALDEAKNMRLCVVQDAVRECAERMYILQYRLALALTITTRLTQSL